MKPNRTAAISAVIMIAILATQVAPDFVLRGARGESPPEVETAAAGEWWKTERKGWLNLNVPRDEVVGFALYTVQNGVLKMTAQLYPLLPDESREVRLEIERDGEWTVIATAEVVEPGWAALFRVEDWDHTRDRPYRVLHGEAAAFEGTIRRDPVEKKEIVVAALSCNSNKDRGARDEYVRNIRAQDPDLLFFAGDQSYDHREHTAAWLQFGRQFADILRDRPVITIPDDHDIGQGNLWGEGGIEADSMAGDSGGYFFPPWYVRMVERSQTAHLPDPYDPTPVARGIGVYYTSLRVGGADFAIIEDRKFKSGPKGKIPQQGPRPDHINDPAYDPASIDLPGLALLGERQLGFLREWGGRWEGVKLKAVLSQTALAGSAHLHGPKHDRLHADLDSNGWPQAGRNRALREIRRAFAVHIAGDQHVSTLVRHGVDDWNDASWSFVVPAIVNNYYSRWWDPVEEPMSHDPGSPLPATGDYFDGFRNRLTVRAYANPDSAAEGAGYGLIRFDTEERTITFECWPRDADVTQTDARQFPGWPVTVRQTDNYERAAAAWLPRLRFTGARDPVIQVVSEETGEILYTFRIKGAEFTPRVFAPGRYTLRVGREAPSERTIPGVLAVADPGDAEMEITF